MTLKYLKCYKDQQRCKEEGVFENLETIQNTLHLKIFSTFSQKYFEKQCCFMRTILTRLVSFHGAEKECTGNEWVKEY